MYAKIVTKRRKHLNLSEFAFRIIWSSDKIFVTVFSKPDFRRTDRGNIRHGLGDEAV